ncbi:hypothetical protein PCANC_12266 [Puccinia coronata f. sp. avenae]|uniref:Uncharacterized protein n=1 Tax=Puccinia coronata f. sp. avenae TaxID=200324 RepID=A0A2N5SZ84_9BASI|nr:hypothetical protein PCANC_12266 [Puccinia coronata f. sp. avenae]PLW42662.1 hypothetical protein PCASD_08496 [Puccinia coronata f. sp. avenae]
MDVHKATADEVDWLRAGATHPENWAGYNSPLSAQDARHVLPLAGPGQRRSTHPLPIKHHHFRAARISQGNVLELSIPRLRPAPPAPPSNHPGLVVGSPTT